MTTTTPKTPHPFKAARNAAVPIMAIVTADPAATIRACEAARNGRPDTFLTWDCVGGLRPRDGSGEALADSIGKPLKTQNLVQCLALIADTKPQDCTIFIHNAHIALESYPAKQAMWNLRDILSGQDVRSCLVLMGPALVMPPELANDVPVFDEPIPTTEDIEDCIDEAVANGKRSMDDFPMPKPEQRMQIADTLTGYLARFAIEQSLALCTTKQGLDVRKLWTLKVASLRNTAGLDISQPTTAFKDMAGCYGSKDFFGKLIKGKRRFRGVFFLDEIEKMLAGQNSTDGTTKAMIEQFLYWTEAKKVLAVLLLGVPGAGKSWTAQCVAGEAGVPLLRGSFSTAKGGIVGSSEANMKQLLKTVDAVTQESPLVIATCNSLEDITPEILARFKLGVFFYDYPTDEEQAALWQLYVKQYGLTDAKIPKCENWVGRDVEACCARAWNFDEPLAEAARSIVSVSTSNKTRMEVLRKSASDKFLSASKIGIYSCETKGAGRKLTPQD